MVDDEDFEKFNVHKWRTMQVKDRYFYAGRNGKRNNGHRPLILLHREIMKAPAGMEVDHVNGNTLDCRKENMRICTGQQNRWNQKRQNNKSSKYKGVSWFTNDRAWIASIRINGNAKYLGFFHDEKQAALAYDKAATELFGEFARTNF